MHNQTTFFCDWTHWNVPTGSAVKTDVDAAPEASCSEVLRPFFLGVWTWEKVAPALVFAAFGLEKHHMNVNNDD